MTRPAEHHVVDSTAVRGTGFTLIELLISVTVLGMIMTVLAFATVTVIRTVPSTEQHVDDARALRALTSWLSQDAMSTVARNATPGDPRGLDTNPSSPALCDATADTTPLNTNLVRLAWQEDVSGSTRAFVSDYRFDDAKRSIVRVACQGSDFADLGPPEVLKLTEGLYAIDVAAYDADLNELVIGLIGESGAEIEIEIASRNPRAT